MARTMPQAHQMVPNTLDSESDEAFSSAFYRQNKAYDPLSMRKHMENFSSKCHMNLARLS